MIRRPPRSTLFPYTTPSDLPLRNRRSEYRCRAFRNPGGKPARLRSEEHTSELQSRRDLVCRLLLEKKNTLTIDLYYYLTVTSFYVNSFVVWFIMLCSYQLLL